MESIELPPGVSVGPHTKIGPGLKIYLRVDPTRISSESTSNFQGISIGANVNIGPNCGLMENISIGTGALIHPESLVDRDVLPFEIVRGNPLVSSGFRFTPEQCRALEKIQWWNWDDEKIFRFQMWLKTTQIDEFILQCGIKTPSEELTRFYNQVVSTPSDINQHLPILRQYAGQCETVIEAGVSSCVFNMGIIDRIG